MAFGVDDAIVAAGITAAGSALAAGGSAVASGRMNRRAEKFNREEAERQRQWNEAMAEKQNAWNYDMWLKQNEYNSPAAQVERLRAAGLNPLYYGLDGSTAGEITAAQPLGYERASAPNYQNVVGAGLDAAAKVAQISNIQADTAKKEKETLTEVAQREKTLAEIENTKQQLQNLLAQEGLTKAETERIQKDLDWCDRLNTATLAAKEAETELSKTNKHRIDTLLDGEKILQSKNIEDFEHKWSKISGELKKMSAETDILYEDLENYALNHTNNGFMGTGISFQNLLRGGKQGAKSKKARGNYEEGMSPDELRAAGQ